MGRERTPLTREGAKGNVTINIAEIFRNPDIQDEVISRLHKIKPETRHIYGVLSSGTHIDVSKSIKVAKRYATLNGFNIVTIRYNCGYIAEQICERVDGKWKPISDGLKTTIYNN